MGEKRLTKTLDVSDLSDAEIALILQGEKTAKIYAALREFDTVLKDNSKKRGMDIHPDDCRSMLRYALHRVGINHQDVGLDYDPTIPKY